MLLASPLAGRAGEPATILKGYGKTTWGESLAEVQKLFPAGKVEPSGPPGPVEMNDKVLLAADPTPFYQMLNVPGNGSVERTYYWFGKGHLFQVIVVLSGDALKVLSQQDIHVFLATKYPGIESTTDARTAKLTGMRPIPPESPVTITANASGAEYENKQLAAKISEDYYRHLNELRQKKVRELKLEEAL